MRFRRLRSLALASVLLLSCASRQLPLEQRPPLLVLPLNFDWNTPAQLQPGLEVLTDPIVAYAQAEGFRCQRVRLSTVVERWSAVLKETGGLLDESGSMDPSRLEVARGALVRALVAEAGSAGDGAPPPVAVLVPSLVTREAPFTSRGTTVHWDGVYRKPPMRSVMDFRREKLLFTGSLTATSLWASLYAPDGELLESAYGGLEVAMRLDWLDRKGHLYGKITYHYTWVERDDLFQDPENITNAVEMALEPVLERAPERP